jgi:hypothetical protein
MSLVAIKGPIDTKLVREDKLLGPIAHLGPVLILHSRVPIGVGKHIMYRGRN